MEGKGRCIDLTDLAGVGRGKQGALHWVRVIIPS
jgi:hypothetical protein